MSPTPQPKLPVAAAPGQPAHIASMDNAQGRADSAPPPQTDSAADVVVSKMIALRLDTYAQTLRMLSPPTAVAPPAGDEVSALTAAQFGAYARMLQHVNCRVAAAHEALLKQLRNHDDSVAIAEISGATPAT